MNQNNQPAASGAKKLDYGMFLRSASVPLMFILICAFCIPIAGLSPSYLAN